MFRVFFECTGLASAGLAPYATLAPRLVDSWLSWLEPHLAGADVRNDALRALSVLDGLLLLRHTSGAGTADAAARALGVIRQGRGQADLRLSLP